MVSNFTRKLYLIVLLQLLAINILVKAETLTAVSYNGGTGTEADPFQINTLAQLRLLSESPDDWDAYFIQTADIDASDTQTWNVGDHDNDVTTADEAMGFSPIGDEIYYPARQGVRFNGNYNGNGYLISGLYINRPIENYFGLFGYVQGSGSREIKYLALTNANVTGQRYVGIIAGETVYTIVNNCYTTGVVGAIYGHVGGLVGACGYANNCYTESVVNYNFLNKGGLGLGLWNTNDQTNCYYNNDLFTEKNEVEFGIGISPQEIGSLIYYKDWNIIVDENLPLGASPVLDNNANKPVWKINPSLTYTTTFIVKNSNDIPIKGAVVSCKSTAVTDENGNVRLELMPNSSNDYSVTAYGKVIAKGIINIENANLITEIILEDAYSGGDGTVENPFQVGSLDQLRNLSQNTQDWDANFIQIEDIDALDTKNWNVGDADGNPSTEDIPMGFSPIGDCTTNNKRQGINFTGSYNGNGYSIVHLYINRPNENYVGLFGTVDSGTSTKGIHYLAVIDAEVRGQSNVGLLVGYDYSSVINCYSSGVVHGGWNTGGLVGSCMYSNVNNIDQCYSIATVDCISDLKGGLGCGYWNSIDYKECYYNSDIFTEPNQYEFGVPLSTQEMGNISYYSKWNVLIDETLTKGAPPVLDNNGNNPTWKINPATTYTVTFSIKNSEGNSVAGASIIFKGKRFTSENGDVQVSVIPNSSAEYVIQAHGFILKKGTINIDAANVLKEVIPIKLQYD